MIGSIDFLAIISVAFLGSFGHCIGMCGGFVLAYTSTKIDKSSSALTQFFLHVIYHLGRISSYVLLGMVFGYIGQSLSFSKVSAGYVYFVVGILMVLAGLSLLGKIRFLTLLESSFALHPLFKKTFSFLLSSKSISSFFLLGALNGFLPCGLVYFFLISAVATGSAFYGGVYMLIFGFSTLPAMVGFGFVVSSFKNSIFQNITIKLASIVIIFYGIYLSFIGFLATQSIN